MCILLLFVHVSALLPFFLFMSRVPAQREHIINAYYSGYCLLFVMLLMLPLLQHAVVQFTRS